MNPVSGMSGHETIPPMRLMELRNILTTNGGIKSDPRIVNLAKAPVGTGAKSIQVIGVTRWYLPDSGCYDYNGLNGSRNHSIPNLDLISSPGDPYVGSPTDPGQFINILV